MDAVFCSPARSSGFLHIRVIKSWSLLIWKVVERSIVWFLRGLFMHIVKHSHKDFPRFEDLARVVQESSKVLRTDLYTVAKIKSL